MKKLIIGMLIGISIGFLVGYSLHPSAINKKTVNNPTATQQASQDLLSKEELIILVNGERLKRGITGLDYDLELESFAELRAKEIADNSETRHQGLEIHRKNGTLPQECPQNRLGENIYYNQSFEPLTNKEVLDGWMNSPAHKPNILNKNYIYYGLGIYKNNVALEFCLREGSDFASGLYKGN